MNIPADGEPFDPVGDMWRRQADRAHRFVLTLMDETLIMSAGEAMEDPDLSLRRILGFERLESDPDPRSLAQRKRRSTERALKRQAEASIRIAAVVMVSRRLA